jgi:hypothetical protein
VINSDDDSMSIENSNNFFILDRIVQLTNLVDNNYDEIAYPFSERIKLKHEPEAAQEKLWVRVEPVPAQREEPRGKHFEGHSPQIMNPFWIANSQNKHKQRGDMTSSCR